MNKTELDIIRICDNLKDMLIQKNMAYGDSALNPLRVMSNASTIEQLLVRIDDKLNRIRQGRNLLCDDEDVIQDLIGYFILLKIAVERDAQNAYNEPNATV
jgi:hypothetical protein